MGCRPSALWRGVMTNCFLRAPTVVAPARPDVLPFWVDDAEEDGGAPARVPPALPVLPELAVSAVSLAAAVPLDDAPRPALRPSSAPASGEAPSDAAPGSDGVDAPP